MKHSTAISWGKIIFFCFAMTLLVFSGCKKQIEDSDTPIEVANLKESTYWITMWRSEAKKHKLSQSIINKISDVIEKEWGLYTDLLDISSIRPLSREKLEDSINNFVVCIEIDFKILILLREPAHG